LYNNNNYTLMTVLSRKPRLPVFKLLITWLTAIWLTEVQAAQCTWHVVSCVAVILSVFCNTYVQHYYKTCRQYEVAAYMYFAIITFSHIF